MKGGNIYQKYSTPNPVARALVDGFARTFDALADRLSPGVALEVGCGEGELCRRLVNRGWEANGFDVDPEVIDEARRRDAGRPRSPSYFVGDIRSMTPQSADLVVCCEVLEHLAEPAAALRKISTWSPYLLASVPREPIWRALNVMRGAYLRDFGNTPGHVQHWSGRAFAALLNAEYDILALRHPLPWTMALCSSRRFGRAA